MSLQRLKIRRSGGQVNVEAGDYVQYDTSLFRIIWDDPSHAPSPAWYVFAKRTPQFIRDGKRIDLYRDSEGQEWLGTASREIGSTNVATNTPQCTCSYLHTQADQTGLGGHVLRSTNPLCPIHGDVRDTGFVIDSKDDRVTAIEDAIEALDEVEL